MILSFYICKMAVRKYLLSNIFFNFITFMTKLNFRLNWQHVCMHQRQFTLYVSQNVFLFFKIFTLYFRPCINKYFFLIIAFPRVVFVLCFTIFLVLNVGDANNNKISNNKVINNKINNDKIMNHKINILKIFLLGDY